MIFDVSQVVPNDPREEVMIFGVSRGPPTEEVMIFVVSQGVPTDPLQEVMIFGVPLRAPTEPTKRQTDRQTYFWLRAVTCGYGRLRIQSQTVHRHTYIQNVYIIYRSSCLLYRLAGPVSPPPSYRECLTTQSSPPR